MDQHREQLTAPRRGRRVAVGSTAVLAALVGACLVAGCAGSSPSADTSGGAAAGVSSVPAPAGEPGSGYVAGSGTSGSLAVPAPTSGTDSGSGSGSDSGSGTGTGVEKMPASTGVLSNRSVVRTASVTVRVDDVLATSAKAEAVAEGLGGFVSGEKTTADPDQPSRSEAVVTLRVPADRMPALLTQLRALGTLLSEDQSADDVTGQVIDVAARISAQRASVARIRALMARATTLGQVVQIEGELTARQAALESLEGQAAALADQTTLATVTTTIVGPKAVHAATHHEATTPSGFGAGLSRGWHAFSVAGTWLLTAIGVLLPFLVLLTPFALAGYVLARRRTKGEQAPASSEPPAPAAA